MALKLETRELPITAPTAPAPRPADGVETMVIQPGRGWGFDLRELWRYRGLFGFLVWRDIKIRYAQTVLGAGWAILQPVLTMIVFTIIFGNFANIPSDGVPYPVFSLAALVPWTYFSTAISNSSSSLVSSANLITKIYFPRLVIPLSPVLAGLVDFGIAFVILLVTMLFFGILPMGSALVVVPVALLITVLTAAGVGCWMAALNLQYRDVKYVVPFMVQVWMYTSPIVYPMSIVPERYHTLYAMNPMTGAIEGFRAALLGTSDVPWGLLALSSAAATVIFLTGALYFRRTERVFADVV
jgi:lipopolysaccharide transport system permease protein